MGFKENLLKKIEINKLTQQVLSTLGPADSERRLDRDIMRNLLEMGDFSFQHERDLDLYLFPDTEGIPLILVLDNELKLYKTTVDDVALRKSPTTKEMISIRNAIKILNDKDVVVSRKADTVERVRTRLINGLDLFYAPADIEALARDGRDALQNSYAEGVLETLALFAELLGYTKAPRIFQLPHQESWGRLETAGSGEMAYGPLVIFNRMQSSLHMYRSPINSRDKSALEAFRKNAGMEGSADLEGPGVWEALKNEVSGP